MNDINTFQAVYAEYSELSALTRDDLIDGLFFLPEDPGGSLYEIGFLSKPLRGKDDWKSVVGILEQTKVHASDDELRWLLAYSRAKTARYDLIFNHREGANIFIMGVVMNCGKKMVFHKKMTWEFGQYWSNSIEEAIPFACVHG